MKKTPFYLILLLIASASCEEKKSNEPNVINTDTVTIPLEKDTLSQPKLEQVWATDTVLTTSESVLYDPARNIYYVSNIEGDPIEKDKKGSISILDTSGSVSNRDWSTGLNAPKGLAQLGDKLYVTDIDRLVEIDKNSGKITNEIKVPGSIFLNDIAEDTNSNVLYISDSEDSKIYKFENGKISVWLDKGINGPNGLYLMNDKLYVASFKDSTLNTVDLNSKNISIIASGIPNADGVEFTGNEDNFLVSNWGGEVYLVKNGNAIKLLDTKGNNVNSADIEYVQSKNLLLVPTFFNNRVTAYRLTE